MLGTSYGVNGGWQIKNSKGRNPTNREEFRLGIDSPFYAIESLEKATFILDQWLVNLLYLLDRSFRLP